MITRVALRVRPVAAEHRHEGWFARSFADGAEALRRLEQEGLAPDIARLSDETETRVGLALAGPGGPARRAGLAATRALGYGEGCVLVLGWEGAEGSIGARRRPAANLLRRAGLLYAGRGPGEAWARTRFAGPHLRDDLLDRGALVETLETATSWTELEALRDAVAQRAARRAAATPSSAATSRTCTRRARRCTSRSWRRATAPTRSASGSAPSAPASDAIAAAGATITHHHAVGRDHGPWLADEHGPLGLELLRALKERCDPAGIMNPGVLAERF